jgi:hypothetical protein
MKSIHSDLSLILNLIYPSVQLFAADGKCKVEMRNLDAPLFALALGNCQIFVQKRNAVTQISTKEQSKWI